ncbi:MAG: hypothetical protein QOK29_53 [Rhodospirillaceae bacterium]|jgi:hypothetical protein|nr:hypothetical protein [Rhodospirillaceae bacterium]
MAYRRYGSLSDGRSNDSAEALARSLGWFSIGLGLVEVLAPRRLARGLGMEGSETLLRLYGGREIANGIGILCSRDRVPWLWGRVGGDALDIATLTSGLKDSNPRKENVGLALGAVAMITAADVTCAQALRQKKTQPRAPLRDYSDRRGFPRPPEEMRGAASDFETPRDMRTPEAMRPMTSS